MAEEEVVAAASPAPSDHKRKLEDLEPEAREPAESTRSEPDESNANLDLDGVENAEVIGSDASDAKRPRLDDKTDGTVTENGYQAQKVDEPPKENTGQPAVDTTEQHAMDNEEQPAMQSAQSEDVQDASKESQEIEKNEELATGDPETDDTRQPSLENPELEETEIPAEEVRQPSADVPKEGDTSFSEEQPASDTETVSRKMEVPNNKVGVLIGKAGDTIRYLQYNSGAKIQITRDADADPYSTTRPVELIGSLANINKAEKLISDVIAEADAGGSPSLVARGFATAPAAGASEQIQIQVPNEKVGLIIGRGGETIKSLQTRSGARIQLIPQHLAEGDQSKERTVRVSGDKKQIEMARELIKEVMNQPVRPSPLSTGYNQQPYRQRGPSSHSQWGPRGPHLGQPSGYDYQQRGPYPSQHPQYPPQNYGNYPHHQQAPRSSFGSGWEQRPPANMQGPPHSGGYDYYGGPVGHVIDGPASAPHSAPIPSHGPGHNPAPAMGPPHSQANYNYGQPHGPDYGQPAPYSQTAPPQSYGHGYDEMKYENQAPAQHPYGGHGSSQPGYSQGGAQPGYGQQQQYGKPSYGMPAQGAPSQSYGPPRASQPGDYQGPVSSTQSYGQNVQQPYPYASSGPMQQTYQSYGSQPAPDGYNQPQVASGPGYPQQGGQPVPGYGQPGGQQAPGYAQGGAAAGYGAYPSSQPGYTEQPAANAGYGYQGTADPGYASGPGSAYAAPPSSQPGYAQAPTQPGYEQSVPQSGGYGSAPVGYGKSVSPQPQPGYPQYDSTQMYGAPR